MFEKWKAQTQPWMLNEAETNAFLNEPVEVVKIERIARWPGICRIRGAFMPCPMTRIVFLRLFVVWYAAAVLGVQILNFNPNGNPQDEAVKAALYRLEDLSAEDFNNYYYEHMFDKEDTHLGYYARSPASGHFAVSMMLSLSHLHIIISHIPNYITLLLFATRRPPSSRMLMITWKMVLSLMM
jgi:hypothetical protein